MEKILGMFRSFVSWFSIFLILALLFVGYHAYRLYNQMKEYERKYENLRVTVEGAKESSFRDTLSMSETSAKNVYKAELPNESTALIKDAGDRVGDVESLGTSATSIRDTILLGDTVKLNFHYADHYATIDIIDSVMYYNIRDSLTTIVTTDYKHRFLWWRWGKKGYHVKIISHNPHSRISYNEYLKVIH